MELQVFENSEFGTVRTLMRNNEPFFVASDVCKALGINNSRDAVARLDEDERGVASIDTLGGEQVMSVISESGLYSLVLGSRKPEAKSFKRWITHDVIPSIRRHGAYMTPATIDNIINNPDFGIKLLNVLKEEREKNKKLTAKIEEDKPKTIFADAVSTSRTSILIGDLSKLIKQNGYDIGQKRLFEWLRINGYLIKSGSSWNMPTQRAMDMKLFEVKESTIQNPDGSVRITKTTKVTGKGQVYFVNIFMKMKDEEGK